MPSTIPSSELVVMLASSLGQDQADRAVGQAITTLRLRGASLSQADCERVLDELGLTPGLVGVVARFAKARVPFMFGPTGPAESRLPSARRRNPRLRSIGLSGQMKALTPSKAMSQAPEPRFDRRGSRPRMLAARRPSTDRRADGPGASPRGRTVGLGRIVEFFADGMDPREADRLVRSAVDEAHLESRLAFTRSEANRILDLIAERGGAHRTNAMLVRARLGPEFR